MKRIFYAHAICTYTSLQERRHIRAIQVRFGPAHIVNPSEFEKQTDINMMDYCLYQVELCDMLVYSPLLGYITAGVGKEINLALERGIRVYEIDSRNRFGVRRLPVMYLSREDTRGLYQIHRAGRPRPAYLRLHAAIESLENEFGTNI